MINKISIFLVLLFIAVVTAVVYSKPARVSADALDCLVAKYRRIGYRTWFHNQAMVDRGDFLDIEE